MWKKQAVAVAAVDDAGPGIDARRVPQTSVSIDWILAQTGTLVDGSVASLRFRENIESAGVTLVDLEAWVLQALQRRADPSYRHAFQDLVHSVGKRLGLKVQYGNYDRGQKGWLPFDGLWWLDTHSFVCVQVHPERLSRLELDEVLGNLEQVHDLGGIFAEARGTVVLVLAEGYTSDLEPVLRSHGALESIRLMGIDTLFDMARMHEAGVLTAGQLPVLFSPFDSMRMGQVIDFLERFMSRFDEPTTGMADEAASPEPSPQHAPRQREPQSEAPRLRLMSGGLPSAEAVLPVPVPKSVDAVPIADRRQRLEMLKEVFALFKQGQYADCLPLLEKFVSVEDSNPRAWEIYGDLSLKTGRHGEAVRAYERVLALAPPNRGLSFRLSGLYETQGDLREAVRVLEDYARAVPQEAREIRIGVARLLARSGDHRSAASVCDRILADGPWDREIVELREQSLAATGERPSPVPASPPHQRFGRWLNGLIGGRA